MRTYSQIIQAGAAARWDTGGKKFQVLEGLGGTLDIELLQNNSPVYQAYGVGVGMWAVPERGGFNAVTITNKSGNPQKVVFFITQGDAGFDQPIASLTVGGEVNARPVMDSAISAPATVVVGTAATLVVAANVNRRGLRLLNDGAAAVRIGGAGVTMSSPMVLNPGDYYDETQVPGVAWYAISGTAGQNLRVIEVS